MKIDIGCQAQGAQLAPVVIARTGGAHSLRPLSSRVHGLAWAPGTIQKLWMSPHALDGWWTFTPAFIDVARPEATPIGRSEFVRVRGLRLHVRRFGCTQSPVLIVLHGWMDASSSFVPLIEQLLSHFQERLQVIAPDWRGHGYSEWSQNGYSVADYVADLDALFGYYTRSQATALVGHSMGAHVAALYAGLRPHKISGLACLDGFNLPDMPLSLAPSRYRRWLDQTKNPPKHEVYPDFETLARRIVRHHPRLGLPQARRVARCWAAEVGNGQVRLLADPLHRLRGPGLYHVSDSEVIWRLVRAPTLLLQSSESEHRDAISVAERQRRHSCFRNRRIEELPGIGHMLHFEDPQRTARSLANFLSEVFR